MAQRTETRSSACRAAFPSVESNRPKPDEAEKLKEKIKQLQERNQRLQQDQLLYEREISRLQRNNQSLSSKLRTIEQELQTQRDQVTALEKRACLQRFSRHIELQARLDQARKEAAEQQLLLQLKHENLQGDFQTLLSEKEALLEENQRLQQESSQILEEKEDLLLERDVLLKTKDGVDKKVRLLMADKVQVEAALEAERNNNAKSSQLQQEEIQRLQASVAGLSALLCAFQEEHGKEAVERLDLQQQKITLQQEKVHLLNKQNELQKENEAMQELLTKKKTGCFSFLRRTKKPGPNIEQNPSKDGEQRAEQKDKTKNKEHKDDKTERKKGGWSWWHKKK
ncbi:protein Daple-like [Amphiprion ocellaris]|uniref:protein Daple-like n=1 Tax=Amphiprion ocellaris TaxID=80972 RepID=UPI00241186D1|nr:protein Daple-like [Amphiprion ocellaris]